MLTIDQPIQGPVTVSAQEHDVARVNSIAELFKPLRQEGKTPTFLLTYGGTHIGMMAQCGFTKSKAQLIEERYHVMYKESDDWVSAKLDEASKVGYLTVAFGLRVRTPLLAQVVRGNSATPHEAEAEGRTAGNALGQSYGLLNNRASIGFMKQVRTSPYRLDVRPFAHIHDAQYYMVRDDISILRWVNEKLVKEAQWQEDPLIAHDIVKLGGNLSVFHPNWAYEITLPNDASEDEVYQAVDRHFAELASKGTKA